MSDSQKQRRKEKVDKKILGFGSFTNLREGPNQH